MTPTTDRSPTAEPAGSEALFVAALRLLRAGFIAEARGACTLALTDDPVNPDGLNLLGVIEMRAFDHEAANRSLKESLALRPDHPDTLSNYAHCQVLRQNAPAAISAFRRYLALRPYDVSARMALAAALDMEDDESCIDILKETLGLVRHSSALDTAQWSTPN